MVRNYFYFDFNYYGVGFCEEGTVVEAEKMTTISVDDGHCGERAAGVLPEQGAKDYWNPVSSDNYEKHDVSNTDHSHQEPDEEELEETGSMAGQWATITLQFSETIQAHTWATVGTADGISKNSLSRNSDGVYQTHFFFRVLGSLFLLHPC